tara:strand:- start:57 stop:758 length:702 start_codon:yes stop_codon:yes gene_type:complete
MKYIKKNKTEPFYYLAEIDLLEKLDENELPKGFELYIVNPHLENILLKHERHAVNLFIGNNASSGCHMHIEDNYILNQVFGSKTIYLFDYDDSNHMITKNCDSLKKTLGITYCEYKNFITENFFDLDHNKFNNLYKVTLNPGDSLVIPPHWWHATNGHGINCSITNVIERKNLNYLYYPTIKTKLWIIYYLSKVGLLDIEERFENIEDFIDEYYGYIFLILCSLFFLMKKKSN